MEEKEKINVLYVDDEVNNLTAFKANFRRDFKVFTAENGVDGTKILDTNKIHVIVTDQRMPKMTGVEFLESILERHPDPIRMLLTGFADIEAVIDSINKGKVYSYITKPWDEQALKTTILNAYELYALREEKEELLRKLERANQQLEFLLRQRLLS